MNQETSVFQTVQTVNSDQTVSFKQEEVRESSVFKNFDYDKIPIVDLVNEMIADAVAKRASDMHFDPTDTDLHVRFRIDGSLVTYAIVPDSVRRNLTTRIKILAGMNITEMRLPQDGAIKMTVADRPLDMRVATLPTVGGEKVVIRLLDYSKSLEGLESLGMSDESLDKVHRMLDVPNGIILVTGATGSGKSTTVYSMLSALNQEDTNIITVEDPVEMKMEGLNQVQVVSDIGMTFAAALRSILREDPDIIMIGEMRDDETARIAVRASITGHLVLSTLHTNNALNTIERLTDMSVERYLLGSSLTGIISQRLVKKLCPKCKKERALTPYEKKVFKLAIGADVDHIYEPVGCNDCVGGYMGRLAVHEVLLLDQDIRDAITKGVKKEDLRKLVYRNGATKTILQDGLEKCMAGETSFQEIIRVTDIEADFGEQDMELKNALLGKLDEMETKEKAAEAAKETQAFFGNTNDVDTL